MYNGIKPGTVAKSTFSREENAMFVIIETEDGLTIEQQPPGWTAQDVAAKHNAAVADEGPYASFDEANDALLAIQQDDFDESEAEGRI
jgi:hypothetical protein